MYEDYINGPIDLGNYTDKEVTPEVIKAIRIARDLSPEASEGAPGVEVEYLRGTAEFISDYFGLGGDDHPKGDVVALVYGEKFYEDTKPW